ACALVCSTRCTTTTAGLRPRFEAISRPSRTTHRSPSRTRRSSPRATTKRFAARRSLSTAPAAQPSTGTASNPARSLCRTLTTKFAISLPSHYKASDCDDAPGIVANGSRSGVRRNNTAAPLHLIQNQGRDDKHRLAIRLGQPLHSAPCALHHRHTADRSGLNLNRRDAGDGAAGRDHLVTGQCADGDVVGGEVLDEHRLLPFWAGTIALSMNYI